MIDGSTLLSALDPSTKLVPEWSTLTLLRDRGREAAAAWLAARGGTAAPPAEAPAADGSGLLRSA